MHHRGFGQSLDSQGGGWGRQPSACSHARSTRRSTCVLLQIDVAHRPDGYAHYATFHPTFLYEIVWNLALAAALVWLGRRRAIRAPRLFALYVAGYSLGRIGEELVRVDPAHHVLGLQLNFFVAL